MTEMQTDEVPYALVGATIGLVAGYLAMRWAHAPAQRPVGSLLQSAQGQLDEVAQCVERATLPWGRVVAASHVGKVRERNEDSFLLLETESAAIVAVADGMGGHAGGQVASALAVRALRTRGPEWRTNADEALHEHMLEAFDAIDNEIKAQAEGSMDLQGMGTTLVAAVLEASGGFHAYTGDSRLYLIRHGEIVHRTRDHSAAQILVDERHVTEDQAMKHPTSSRLTACLGGGQTHRRLTVSPVWGATDTTAPNRFHTQSGDIVLLCSDGLHGEVERAAIEALAARHPDPDELAHALLSAALDAGGEDNITLIVARWY